MTAYPAIARTTKDLTRSCEFGIQDTTVSFWKRGLACQVKSHLKRCEENGNQLNNYVDSDVHMYVYVDAIIQHKACTRRHRKGSPKMIMMVQVKAWTSVFYWREPKDGRNQRLFSPAFFVQ